MRCKATSVLLVVFASFGISVALAQESTVAGMRITLSHAGVGRQDFAVSLSVANTQPSPIQLILVQKPMVVTGKNEALELGIEEVSVAGISMCNFLLGAGQCVMDVDRGRYPTTIEGNTSAVMAFRFVRPQEKTCSADITMQVLARREGEKWKQIPLGLQKFPVPCT